MKNIVLGLLILGCCAIAYADPVYTEQKVIDQITVLEDGQIQIREATKVFKDGVEITRSFHRHVIAPDDSAATISKQDTKVKAVIDALWTTEVKDKFVADKLAREE